MTHTSLMATLLNLQATKAMMAAETNPTGYKALVCLFLFGGNDSHNMLVPADGDLASGEYAQYHTIRGGVRSAGNSGGLALEQSTLLPISGQDGRSFGLHPGLAEEVNATPQPDGTTGLAKLYNDGKLAFINNVGSLIEPTTRQQYNQRVNLPLGLFSHSDLQRHWQTGFPQSRSKITGWGGRMGDLLLSTNENPYVSMNISLGGMNLYQTGQDVIPYAIGTGGADAVNDYHPGLSTSNRERRMYTRAVDGMFPPAGNVIDQTYGDLLTKTFSQSVRGSIDAAIEFNNATDSVALKTEFADEDPSTKLAMVARCIGARTALQQNRQVFFVSFGGFDNHNNLIDSHLLRMPRISRAIKSFYDALVELGVENDVTLFTASDFARTLTTNGQGSDHAWGGNHFVMGGGVNGGRMFGDYPTDLVQPMHPEFGDLNLGRGRVLPTTSVDVFSADLAMWFGVGNNQDLETIIPNIRNFYGSGGTAPPLGLFG